MKSKITGLYQEKSFVAKQTALDSASDTSHITQKDTSLDIDMAKSGMATVPIDNTPHKALTVDLGEDFSAKTSSPQHEIPVLTHVVETKADNGQRLYADGEVIQHLSESTAEQIARADNQKIMDPQDPQSYDIDLIHNPNAPEFPRDTSALNVDDGFEWLNTSDNDDQLTL